MAKSHGQKGLGRELYNIAEQFSRDHGYDGVILETVKEAAWLYDWYLNMGFEVHGSHQYPGSTLQTLLLIKRF